MKEKWLFAMAKIHNPCGPCSRTRSGRYKHSHHILFWLLNKILMYQSAQILSANS